MELAAGGVLPGEQRKLATRFWRLYLEQDLAELEANRELKTVGMKVTLEEGDFNISRFFY